MLGSNSRNGEYQGQVCGWEHEDEARIGVTRSWQALNARLKNQECLYDNNAATHISEHQKPTQGS